MNPLWTWTNPACGIYEFATLQDLRAGLAAGRISPETQIWRNAPNCQSIPARFVAVAWTVQRPGLPVEKVDFAQLQTRYLSRQLPAGTKLGQDGNTAPKASLGRPGNRFVGETWTRLPGSPLQRCDGRTG